MDPNDRVIVELQCIHIRTHNFLKQIELCFLYLRWHTLDQDGESVSTDRLFNSEFSFWFVLNIIIMYVYIIYIIIWGD